MKLSPTVEEIEAEFWRIVETPDEVKPPLSTPSPPLLPVPLSDASLFIISFKSLPVPFPRAQLALLPT